MTSQRKYNVSSTKDGNGRSPCNGILLGINEAMYIYLPLGQVVWETSWDGTSDHHEVLREALGALKDGWIRVWIGMTGEMEKY